MKKPLILTVLATVGLSMIRCNSHSYYDQNPLNNDVKRFYETPHQLRKMFIKDEKVTVKESGRGSLVGGFFLFFGGIGGDYQEGTKKNYVVTQVRFAWEIKDNTYIITTLPLEKIRIKLVDKAEAPTVSFFLDEFEVKQSFDTQRLGYRYDVGKDHVDQSLRRILMDYYNPHEALAKYLAYATFTVRSSDWPSNINLPVNQGYSQ